MFSETASTPEPEEEDPCPICLGRKVMDFVLELINEYGDHPFTMAGVLQSVQMELISLGHEIHRGGSDPPEEEA